MPTDKADPPPFADLVQMRRRELGLSRKELVEASGLSYPYIAQLETGQRTPSRRSVARLAEALQLDPDELGSAIPYDEESPRERTTRRASSWQSNPAYAAPLPPTSRPAGRGSPRRDVVQSVVDAVSALPPEVRLDALHEAQKRIVAAMFDDHRA